MPITYSKTCEVKIFVSENLHLIVIGLSESFFHDIKSDNISILNNVSNEILLLLLKDSNYFICTSTNEGLSYPVLDALYFKLNVLALDIPVFREIYEDKKLIYFENEKIYIEFIKDLNTGD